MKAVAAVLLVALSGQGHWFGGREGEVLIQWTTGGKHPESVLAWEVTHGTIRLAQGEVALPADGKPSAIRITPPAVRVRTVLTLKYRARETRGGKEVESGSMDILLYPDNVLEGLAARLRGRTVMVWDEGGTLPKLLKGAGVPITAIKDPAALQTVRADILLVGPGQLEGNPAAEASLLGHVEAGSSVLVFAQTGVKELMGYPAAVRRVTEKLELRLDHPLFAGMEEREVRSLLAGGPADLTAIELPADEPALELAWWPRETPGANPVPIDALLVSKATGKGRLVLCQLPLGNWETDPRSQLFLRNALEYLATRPEPTPPPSQRKPTKKEVKPKAAVVVEAAEAKNTQ